MMDLRQYISGGNPRKIIGIVISMSVVLLILWLFMVSRMDYQSAPEADPPSTERRDSVRVMMGKSDTGFVAEERSSSIFFNAFTTFVVLIIILAGVWFWVRRKSSYGSTGRLFKEYGQQAIGPGHQLKVMEVNNEIWVLGISTDSVSLLHRYPKEQWNEPIPPENRSGQNFYDMFSGKS